MPSANEKIRAAAAQKAASNAAKVASSKKGTSTREVIKTASEQGKQNRIKVKGK